MFNLNSKKLNYNFSWSSELMSQFRTLNMDTQYLRLWLNGVEEKEMFIKIYLDRILQNLVVLMLQEILSEHFLRPFNLQTFNSNSMESLKSLIKRNSSSHIQQNIIHLSWLLLVLFTFQTNACQQEKRDLAQNKSVKFICSCMDAPEKSTI